MKEYPLSKGDMRDLQKTGMVATACFSLGSGLIGFTINLQKDLALAQGVPEKVVSFYSAVWLCALLAGIVLLLAGASAVYDGKTRLKEIEKETVHEGSED